MTHLIIAIEGINGIGKTEALQACRPHLLDSEHDFWIGHELQDGLGLEFHRLVRNGLVLSPNALALMFAAVRINSYMRRCADQPAGTVLIYDRFLWSSLAYHSVRCDPTWVQGINQQGPRANFNILLDADPQQMAQRENRTKLPRTFPKDLEFLQQIRQNFLELVQRNPGRSVVLDATQPPGEVARQLAHEILSFVARAK